MQQRSYFRLEFAETCRINLQQIGAVSLSQGGNEAIEVQMIDISGGGMCLLTNRDFAVSKALTWKFVFSLRGKQYKLLGQFIWRKPHDDNTCRYGVEFIIIDPNLQHELIASINSLQLHA